MAALSLLGMSGCSVKSSDELATEEIEAIFEIFISDKKDSIESYIKVEGAMKTTDSDGTISAVSLSEGDSLKVLYKDIERNVIENYMAPGLYFTNFLASMSDDDIMNIEFIHNNKAIVSNLEFGILPKLTSEEEITLSISDSLSLNWNNNSAKMNNIYISGSCYQFQVIELGLEESSYVFNLDELELRGANTCSDKATLELEWKVSGDFNQEFNKGEITAYITKAVTININD